MQTMQNDIVNYLNDYRSMIGDKAYQYEIDGFNARSERLKDKVAKINHTIADYVEFCSRT